MPKPAPDKEYVYYRRLKLSRERQYYTLKRCGGGAAIFLCPKEFHNAFGFELQPSHSIEVEITIAPLTDPVHRMQAYI